MRRNALLLLGAIVCAAVMAGPASAQVQPAGTGEPALHELDSEHAVVRVARDSRDRRLPGPLRLLREQRAGRPTRPRTRRRTAATNVWANWSGVRDASARRPVRHLRAGPVHVPERLAVDPGRSELVLDGHDARAAGRTRRSTARSRRRRSSSRAAPRSPGTRTVALKVDFADDVAGPFPANFLCFQVGGSAAACATRARARSTATTRRARSPAAPASRRRSTAPPTSATSRTATCGPA